MTLKPAHREQFRSPMPCGNGNKNAKVLNFNANIYMLATLALFSGCLVLSLYLAPKPDLLDGIPFGSAILDKNGRILKLSLSRDQKYRLRTTLDNIAPEACRATLLYEDKYFYDHPGVNPFSLLRAAARYILTSGKIPGASTITMQVARLRENLTTSHLGGKLRQIWLSLLIEFYYSKEEILEAYFNLAPYGGNIEGIEAAARIYFNKSASQLTDLECHALAVVPQNPASRHPATGRYFQAARSRLEQLLGAPNIAGNLDKIPPLHVRKTSQLPFVAPHLALELLADCPKEGKTILTGIESDLQSMLENTLRDFARRGRRYGIDNAAAIIVNSATMQVAALAGSANFNSESIQGQIDGTKARRSPGSTLKPFIYALALDQGLIHPLSILPDAPRSFGGYDPENFDRSFRGPLPARDALAASRNLPAILLAEQLRSPGLYGFLRDANVRLEHGPAYYGLALALGGAEISIRELAALYAMLANQGIWRPLSLTTDGQTRPARRMLSPEAAWLTLWMLERENENIASRAGEIPLRYKTGTSNGLRDAWTAGLAGEYVLVVWVGNFDNSSNQYFVGAKTALPLFRKLAYNLAAMRPLTDMQKKILPRLNLASIKVCAPTGDVTFKQCGDLAETWFIPGVSPTRESGVLRPTLIDKATGLRACQAKAGETEEIYWEFWPEDMRQIFEKAGIHKPLPPEWLPECRARPHRENAALGKPPRIMSPKKNVIYHKKLSGGNLIIPLLASADSDSGNIHWYAGSAYIGSAKAGETYLWRPEESGDTEIMAIDGLGRSARQKCKILATP